jgi:hypothetical protein
MDRFKLISTIFHFFLALEPSVISSYPTQQLNIALEPSVMSMYPNGRLNLAKDPSVMPHYMSVFLIIRPKKLVIGQSLSLFSIVSLTPFVMSLYLSMYTYTYISSLAPSEKSLCFFIYLMGSQNILKMCIFSFWISLNLEKWQCQF